MNAARIKLGDAIPMQPAELRMLEDQAFIAGMNHAIDLVLGARSFLAENARLAKAAGCEVISQASPLGLEHVLNVLRNRAKELQRDALKARQPAYDEDVTERW